MSRSKEGREQTTSTQQGRDQTANRENVSNTSSQQAQMRNQYISGRESRRDYPRRSTSANYREQSETSGTNQPITGGYERHRGADRSTYNQPSQYRSQPRYANEYENRQRYQDEYRNRDASTYRNEYGNRRQWRQDTGDFYSQGIRQSTSGSRQYDDPYRTYERGSQYEQGQGQYDYDRNPYTSGQNYDVYNREGNYSNQRDTYDRDNRQYRDEETQRYRTEENRNYHSETQPYREQNQYNPYYNDYGTYNVDRVDPAMMNLEYGYAYGYPFGLQWGDRTNVGHRREMLRCRDIMTKDVTTCMPQTTIREAADRMEDENVGSLPVVENGRLTGIVTDRDIVCRVLAEGMDTRTLTVKEAMSEDIVTCSPDESVVEAIHKMGEHQIRRLPVCDSNGRVRGIISLGDLALEAENDVEIARALEHISESTPYQSHRR